MGVGHRILNRFDPSAEAVGGLSYPTLPIEGAKYSAARIKQMFIAFTCNCGSITRLDEGEERTEGASSNRKTAVLLPTSSQRSHGNTRTVKLLHVDLTRSYDNISFIITCVAQVRLVLFLLSFY